jgi:outer membrane protein TolC
MKAWVTILGERLARALLLAFLLAVSGSGVARGEPAGLSEQPTLGDYLSFAEEHNPGLRAAYRRWQAAEKSISKAKALPDPRLTYGYFVEPVETRVGPQRQTFGVSQRIPWLGKIGARKQVASHRSDAEREVYAAEKLRLFHRVKRLYHDLAYLHRAMDITEDNVALLTQLEPIVRSQYQGGAASQSALLKIQVEIARLEDRREGFADQGAAIAAQLNAALGRPADADLPRPVAAPAESLRVAPEELLAWLEEHNPDLRAMDYRADSEKAAASLAGKSYFPDLSLGFQYIEIGESAFPGVEDSGKDAMLATVAINLPLWFGTYKASGEEAQQRYAAARNERDELLNQFAAELHAADYALRDAERRLHLYRRDLLPMARQSLEVTLGAFTAEQVTFLDVVEAERTLLEFDLAHARAVADRGQSLARIEMLVGGFPAE